LRQRCGHKSEKLDPAELLLFVRSARSRHTRLSGRSPPDSLGSVG
jgi:hypothetical protein